ncbi:MAG: ribbon-helix-helix protein, CopG family [Chitinispirillaceae bacterium]|nr:ribbon-helix-helix protein, CopG family [Chitinispirillaceae bacterium]
MRTIQMTLDDRLVREVDMVIKKLHTSRSAFTREALASALEKYRLRQLEEKHRKGYELHPSAGNEFSVWEKEQAWGDR